MEADYRHNTHLLAGSLKSSAMNLIFIIEALSCVFSRRRSSITCMRWEIWPPLSRASRLFSFCSRKMIRFRDRSRLIRCAIRSSSRFRSIWLSAVALRCFGRPFPDADGVSDGPIVAFDALSILSCRSPAWRNVVDSHAVAGRAIQKNRLNSVRFEIEMRPTKLHVLNFERNDAGDEVQIGFWGKKMKKMPGGASVHCLGSLSPPYQVSTSGPLHSRKQA